MEKSVNRGLGHFSALLHVIDHKIKYNTYTLLEYI